MEKKKAENKVCPILFASAIGSVFTSELDIIISFTGKIHSINPALKHDTPPPHSLCLKDECEWWIPGDKAGCSIKKNRGV